MYMKKGKIRIGIGCVLVLVQILSVIGNMKAGIRISVDVTDFRAFLFDMGALLGYYLIGIIGVLLIVWGVYVYRRKPTMTNNTNNQESLLTELVRETNGSQAISSDDTAAEGELPQEDGDIRFCIDCGTLLDPATKTCVACGRQYGNISPIPDIQTTDKPRSFGKVIAAVAVCVVFLVAAIFMCISQHQKTQELQSVVATLEEQIGKQEETILELTNEKEVMEKRIEELDYTIRFYEALYESSEEDNQQLTADIAKYEELAQFVDDYIVFIEDDGTDFYHKYDCYRFKGERFWVLNTEAAIMRDYTPCPSCF